MPTPQEYLIDAHTRHSIDLLRLSARQMSEVLPMLQQLKRELVAEIANMPDPTKWQRQRLQALLGFANKTIEDTYTSIENISIADNSEIAAYEQESSIKMLDTAVKANVGQVVLTTEQLAAIASNSLIEGAPSSAWWARQSAQLQQRFADNVRQGFLRGESVGQMSRRIKPIMDISTREADALVRTSVQSVAMEVREEVIAKQSVAKGYVHISTLDSRTTFICIGRDNLKWNMDKEPIGHSKQFRRPPLHWNCRSTLIPWLKSASELSPKFTREIPEGTRASMNGQVPAALSYPDWLKKQPRSVQREVLGPGRLKLFEEGKLNLRQLVNASTGKPITLEKLRERG